MCIYMTYDHICVYQYVSDSSYRFLCCDCGFKKNWLPSHIHFPFACCMAVRSNTNIHLAGSQFLCGNARHHLRIVFSVMLSVLIFLSYTIYGVGFGSVLGFLIYDRKTPPHSHNFRISQVYDDIIEHGFRIA